MAVSKTKTKVSVARSSLHRIRTVKQLCTHLYPHTAHKAKKKTTKKKATKKKATKKKATKKKATKKKTSTKKH